MTKSNDEWRWNELRKSVIVLASSAAEQLTWLGEAHVDELALEFESARRLVLGLVGGRQVSAELLDLIETIDSELSAISGSSNSELWTRQAVYESERWALIRDLAGRADALWPIEHS